MQGWSLPFRSLRCAMASDPNLVIWSEFSHDLGT
jgi:hypothetical protein